MAVQGRSQAEQTRRWELLIVAVRENLADMPHVAEDLEALEQLLTEARAVESQQDALRADARRKRARLRELTRKGNVVRGRIGANLHGRFGFTDEVLAKFGYRPRRAPSRRPTATEPAKLSPVTPQPPTDQQ